jgi:hypothetical protein
MQSDKGRSSEIERESESDLGSDTEPGRVSRADMEH